MRTNQRYALLSAATALAVVGMSLGAFSFAQTVTPLACTVAPSSVSTNQAATFTATGGTGSYTWSGQNLNVTNATGNQFAVSYPNPGVYAITVTSGSQSVSCNMTVVTTSGAVLACAPATQNVTLGQVAYVSASGGTGTYTWSSPDLSITNATGSSFSANYATTGLKTLTVTSGGATATCAINVVAGSVTPPVTPGLPNTGGGYGQ